LTIVGGSLPARWMRLTPAVVLTQNTSGDVSTIAPIASAASPSRESIVSKRTLPPASVVR